jgi:hypothetical protein
VLQIKTYPRASIDNAKAVRQNAHALQGQLAAAAGKRFAKHMPASVGAWLCGLYDSDRSVAEATQNSLRQVFNTPEKIQNIRKAYQQPLLEYCRDAIDKESAQTLSDERTVSPDDAEAKYSRVISACISLLGSLLANLKQEELVKHQSDYQSLFGNKKLWEFASYGDASIRRSIHRFLKTCLAKQPGRLNEGRHVLALMFWVEAIRTNLETISKSYLSVALNSDQTSSALDYVDTLALLTKHFPTTWTKYYQSKTSVDKRLRQFLKKGSQSAPRDYWDRLRDLFTTLPKEILPTNAADAAELLNSLHGGITRKDESRMSLESAFAAYLNIATYISTSLQNNDQRKLQSEMVLPLLSQYLRPSPENSLWSLPPNSTKLLAQIMCLTAIPSILEEKWPEFTQQFISDIKTSAPEQSKDYERSQKTLVQQATRFATIHQQPSGERSSQLRDVFIQSCSIVISEALNVIKNRNGKPYGATGVVAEFLHRNQELVLADKETYQRIEDFLNDDLPSLVLSASSAYLVDILYSFSGAKSFKSAWTAALKTVLKETDSSTKAKALEAILTSQKIPKTFSLASEDNELQQYIKSSVQGAVDGSLEWDSFNRILQSPAKILSADTTDEILSIMTQSLSLSHQAPHALQGLRQVTRQNPSIMKTFLTTPQGSNLLQSLLLASESPNEEISQSASSISASIQTVLSAGTDTKHSVFELIQLGLQEANQTSVSVETLIELAKQLVKPESTWAEIAGVFPSIEVWRSALTPFLDTAPKTSLTIANSLGGAVYLVVPSTSPIKNQKTPRDADGYSTAYRIAQYVTRLFKESILFPVQKVPSELQEISLRNIALTIQLADDNLGLAGANGLWAEYNADVEADAISFLSDAQSFVTQELKRLQTLRLNPDTSASLLSWATKLLAEIELSTSPQAYYSARAYSMLIADTIEISGWKNSETVQLQETLKNLRRSRGKKLLSLTWLI